MPINNPIIASSSSRRAQAQSVVVTVTSALPPADREYINSDGIFVTDSQSPEVEGSMLMYRDPTTGISTLFVVAYVDNTLTWVAVDAGVSFLDSSTGREWDPLAGLYNYLAS